jgi:hypothetical protein
MSNQPLTVGALAGALARFHRKVVLPDIQRIVGEAVGGSERRLRDEMQTFHDSLLSKLDRLETDVLRDQVQAIQERLGG